MTEKIPREFFTWRTTERNPPFLKGDFLLCCGWYGRFLFSSVDRFVVALSGKGFSLRG
jgi:hypothetical protein